MLAARVGRGKSNQWLYLFTTLALPFEEIVALYGRRWSVETDLRSLKRTMQLHPRGSDFCASMYRFNDSKRFRVSR